MAAPYLPTWYPFVPFTPNYWPFTPNWSGGTVTGGVPGSETVTFNSPAISTVFLPGSFTLTSSSSTEGVQ